MINILIFIIKLLKKSNIKKKFVNNLITIILKINNLVTFEIDLLYVLISVKKQTFEKMNMLILIQIIVAKKYYLHFFIIKT